MKHFLLATLTVFCWCFGFSQQSTKNPYIHCNNPIPKVFHSSPKETVLDSIARLNKNEKRFDRKNKERFILESNFYLDQFYKSGYVCFNDSITRYIESVAKKLLKNNPGLYEQFRFYTLRTSEVNSFCTSDGAVFVTQGLLAQLENEAQLAFVLSHELIHFLKKHAINAYVKDEQIKNERGNYQDIESQKKELLMSSYSRENEAESDSLGFLNIYSKSGYKLEAAISIFNVLLYSDLPIDEIPFNKSFFEGSEYHFPDEYTLKEVKKISTIEDINDEKLSHPNIKKRKLMIKKLIKDKSKGELYLVSKERFDQIKKINQYDLSSLYILDRDYGSAIYNSYILLKKDPQDNYLKETIAESLYYIYKYSNYGERNKVLKNWDNIEGQSQQLFHFLYQLSNEELRQLAFRELWTISQKNISNQLLSRMLESLSIDFFENQRFTLSEIETAVNYNPTDTLNAVDTSEEYISKLNKYEKIEREKHIDPLKTMKLISIASLVIDKKAGEPKFMTDFFSKIKLRYDSLKVVDEFKNSKKGRRLDKQLDKTGLALNIDKLMIFDPFYYKIDERKKTEVLYFDADEKKKRLEEQYSTFSNDLQISSQIFDYNNLTETDAEKFNDFSIIKLWDDQQSEIGDKSIVNYLQCDLQQVAQKYGVKHIAFTGAIAYRKKKNDIGSTLVGSLALSLYFPPAFLYGIYYSVTPIYLCYYSMNVYDCTTGQQVMKTKVIQEERETNDIRSSFIYDALNQIKRNKK